MNATTTNTILDTFFTDISTVLTTSLPLVLSIVAGLIGLGLLLFYVRKWIGRR